MLPIARRLACLAFLAVLTACSSLGLPPAQSFNDRLGYAIAAHTAVLETTRRSLDLGEITSAEASELAAIADNARALIGSARTVHAAGDVELAEQRLAVVLTLLQELQTYLRGAPP